MKKFMYVFIPSILILLLIWIYPLFFSYTSASAPVNSESIIDSTNEQSWQEIITWIIGSLNGLFGLVLLIKKVFSKS
ncbi:MAG: hypothetical protein KAT68_07210 [Bacteroidales bacterium]|nr:hypothetical protein [Bacteroidales bacterium]